MKSKLKIDGLTFPEQIQLIDDVLGSQSQIDDLLYFLSDSPDFEPLSVTMRKLICENLLDSEEIREALQTLFRKLPDTALGRIFRGLKNIPLDEQQKDALVKIVISTLDSFAIERISILCLLERWLRNTDSQKFLQLRQDSEQRCFSVSRNEETQKIRDIDLIRLKGHDLSVLKSKDIWTERLSTFSDSVIKILENAPKSLSQANAEELLARQVYTNPGHFLAELLQNAEDSGAHSWHITIDETSLSLWHNGNDFDAKDVVGILSIGQTTKTKGQIGFFGVGFKSVYEVCERPQIYSGLFQFEIADVSIPRKLSRRPPNARPDGTLIVLPLRNPTDPDRNPSALFKYARSIPPETLLTLDNIEHFQVSFLEKGLSIRENKGADSIDLIHEHSGELQSFFVESDSFQFSGKREADRTTNSPILIAIPLDSERSPTPIETGKPTIFSYLPTNESSGLRFLVHAHFDLPVDRERIDLDSEWNTWALRNSGILLAQVLRKSVISFQNEPNSYSQLQLESFLKVIPHPEELRHKAYSTILEAFMIETRDLPFFIGADKTLIRANQSVLISDVNLTEILAGIPLTSDGKLALKPLQEREQKVAEFLGAIRFDTSRMVDFLKTHVSSMDKSSLEAPPRWFRDSLPLFLREFGRKKVDGNDFSSLPFLPDQNWALQRPDSLFRASMQVRLLYRNERHFLNEIFDHFSTVDQENFLRQLELRTLGNEEFINDLNDTHFAAILSSDENIIPLLSYLDELPHRYHKILGKLPIFPDENGVRRPLTPESHAEQYLFLSPQGKLGEILRAANQRTFVFVLQSLQEQFGTLLEMLGAHSITVEDTIDFIRNNDLVIEANELLDFHSVIDSQHRDLSSKLCKKITRTPIFPDEHGTLRDLRSEKRALIAADPQIKEVLENAPWLSKQISDLEYIQTLGIEPLGAKSLAQSLLLKHDLSLIDPFENSQVRKAHRYLIKNGSNLTKSLTLELARAPLWFHQKGELFPLGELRLEPQSEVLEKLYNHWKKRPIIESEEKTSRVLVRVLGLDQHLSPLNSSTLIDDVLESPSDFESEELRQLLFESLLKCREELSTNTLSPLQKAPIFRDSEGTLRAVQNWSAQRDTGCFRAHFPLRDACLRSSKKILSESDERSLTTILDSIGIKPAEIEDIVDLLETDPAMKTPPAIIASRKALADSAGELAHVFRPDTFENGHPRLQKLEIWPTQSGTFDSSGNIIRQSELKAIFPEEFDLRDLGDISILDEKANDEADQLRGIFQFSDPTTFLIGQIREFAQPGRNLDEQKPFLNSLDKIQHFLKMCFGYFQSENKTLELPLVVNNRGDLSQGQHYFAQNSDIKLLDIVDHELRIAHPNWVVIATTISHDFAPRLPIRTLLAVLSNCFKSEVTLDDHPLLHHKKNREILYQWISDRKDEIAEDYDGRGIFGSLPIIPTSSDQLRAPKNLLLDPTLPDLGLGWGVHHEVPENLVQWMLNTYDLDAKQRKHIVHYVLEGHRKAASEENLSRSVKLLSFLSKFLLSISSDQDLAEFAQRYKLRKNLRISGQYSGFDRPSRLLLCSKKDRDLISGFLVDPPQFVSSSYSDPDITALLIASGVKTKLDRETLSQVLQSGRSQKLAQRALLFLSIYLSRLVVHDSQLRNFCELDQKAWIPNGRGELKCPDELFWPSDDVREILGERKELFPNPAFVHDCGEETEQRFGFKHSRHITIYEAIDYIRESSKPASKNLLHWLEQGLSEKRFSGQDVRSGLSEVAFLQDHRGRPCAPTDCVPESDRDLFSDRRGSWPLAHDYPKLASVLRISRASQVDIEISRFFSEISDDIRTLGSSTLLEREKSLLKCLPICLGRIAKSKLTDLEIPIPLACVSTKKEFNLLLSNNANLFLQSPQSLAYSAQQIGLDIFFPILPPDETEDVTDFLQSPPIGLKNLWSLWSIADHVIEKSDSMKDEEALLEKKLDNIWSAFRTFLDSRVKANSPTVVGVESITLNGTLNKIPCSIESLCFYDHQSQQLYFTSEALWNLESIAELVVKEFLSEKTVGLRSELISLIYEILHIDSEENIKTRLEDIDFLPLRKDNAEKSQDTRNEEKIPAIQQPHEHQKNPSDKNDEHNELDPNEDASLFSRIRRWFSSSEDDQKDSVPQKKKSAEESQDIAKDQSSKSKPKPRIGPNKGISTKLRTRSGSRQPGDHNLSAHDHSQWYKQVHSIEKQLGNNSSIEEKQSPPQYGFSFAPSRLPLPWTYSPKFIATQFTRSSQNWSAENFDSEWNASQNESSHSGQLVISGLLPKASAYLPIPMYSRIEEISTRPHAELIRSRSGHLMLDSSEDTRVKCLIVLEDPPDFEKQLEYSHPVPQTMLVATVPDHDIPDEVHEFLDDTDFISQSPLGRSLSIRGFIRENYKYDPSYLEDQGLSNWLSQIHYGQANVHLSALHSGRDDTFLGRGVCYELNVLACEMLRRAKIPAGIATGWTFSDGSIADPDHLWAMALLPTADGLRWFPIDAATTREGRPLRIRRPAGHWHVQPPPKNTKIEASRSYFREDEQRKRKRSVQSRSKNRRATSTKSAKKSDKYPVENLVRIVRFLEKKSGLSPVTQSILRKEMEKFLKNPEKQSELIELLLGQQNKSS